MSFGMQVFDNLSVALQNLSDRPSLSVCSYVCSSVSLSFRSSVPLSVHYPFAHLCSLCPSVYLPRGASFLLPVRSSLCPLVDMPAILAVFIYLPIHPPAHLHLSHETSFNRTYLPDSCGTIPVSFSDSGSFMDSSGVPSHHHQELSSEWGM